MFQPSIFRLLVGKMWPPKRSERMVDWPHMVPRSPSSLDLPLGSRCRLQVPNGKETWIWRLLFSGRSVIVFLEMNRLNSQFGSIIQNKAIWLRANLCWSSIARLIISDTDRCDWLLLVPWPLGIPSMAFWNDFWSHRRIPQVVVIGVLSPINGIGFTVVISALWIDSPYLQLFYWTPLCTRKTVFLSENSQQLLEV